MAYKLRVVFDILLADFGRVGVPQENNIAVNRFAVETGVEPQNARLRRPATGDGSLRGCAYGGGSQGRRIAKEVREASL